VHSPLFDVMNTSAVANPFGTEAWNTAALAYDCVIAFAVAFSRSTDVNNGAEVAARFREARFHGASGQVQFDLLGDRDPSTINCTSLRIAPVAVGAMTPRAHGASSYRVPVWRASHRYA
jgi:hypothetical protein